MATVTVEEAQAKLLEIIRELQAGEEITITDLGEPVALIKKAFRTPWSFLTTTPRNRMSWTAANSDDPLEEFNIEDFNNLLILDPTPVG